MWRKIWRHDLLSQLFFILYSCEIKTWKKIQASTEFELVILFSCFRAFLPNCLTWWAQGEDSVNACFSSLCIYSVAINLPCYFWECWKSIEHVQIIIVVMTFITYQFFNLPSLVLPIFMNFYLLKYCFSNYLLNSFSFFLLWSVFCYRKYLWASKAQNVASLLTGFGHKDRHMLKHKCVILSSLQSISLPKVPRRKKKNCCFTCVPSSFSNDYVFFLEALGF